MRSALFPLLSALSLAACVKTVVVSQSLADMERTRTAPAVVEASKLVPALATHAEELRVLAEQADARGDAASADLYADRARVAYERVVLLTRLTRATEAGDAAKAATAQRADDAQHLVAARLEVEKEADRTSTELAVAREAKAPGRAGRADSAREKARSVAAASLAAEGRLLCSAARLVAHDPTPEQSARLQAAEDAVRASLTPTGAPIDPIDLAARARAACLDALTRTRRAAEGAGAGDTDALLAALSARGGWAPSRDERGVVVTFRDAFKGGALTPAAEKDLRELGRVAANHPSFPLQVVNHDATPPTEAERALGRARLLAVGSALAAGGAPRAASAVEDVGAALPTTDPADARTRSRNARLEVVFVSPAE